MGNTERQELIRRAVLESLGQCLNYMVPERTLRIQVGLLVPRLLDSEFDEAIRFAQQENYATGTRDGLGSVKWRLTDLGRSVLGELNA